MKFKVGDRVIGVGRDDGINFNGKIGTILIPGEFDSLVKFDERFSDFFYGEDGKCWRLNDGNLNPYEKIEDEIEWWSSELKEKLVTKFKIFESIDNWDGKTYTITPKIDEYIVRGIWPKKFRDFIGRKATICVNFRGDRESYVGEDKVDTWMMHIGSDSHTRYSVPKDCIEKSEIKRIYTEEDPYGEEDWENESVNSDIDPYNEEIWDEEDNTELKKLYDWLIGQIEWGVGGIGYELIYNNLGDEHHMIELLKIDEDTLVEDSKHYFILVKRGNVYVMGFRCNIPLHVGDPHDGRYRIHDLLEERDFILEKLNKVIDSIKNNSVKESFHEDIDPYGEENWEEFSSDLKVGDYIRNSFSPLYNYAKIVSVDGNRIELSSRYGSRWEDFDTIKEWIDSGVCYIDRKVEENIHSDIDPYGEEDWGDVLSMKVGDKVWCIAPVFNGDYGLEEKEYTIIAATNNCIKVYDVPQWWNKKRFIKKTK